MALVVVAGHVCVDITPSALNVRSPEPGEIVAVGPVGFGIGGSVGNAGRVLDQLGLATRVHASVGDDRLGGIAIDLLTGQGLGVTGVSRESDGSTSYSIVLDPPGGDRAFMHHLGANASFNAESVDLNGATALHVGYPTALPTMWSFEGRALRDLLVRAKSLGVATSIDFSTVIHGSDAAKVNWASWLRAILPLVDVVSPSIADLSSMIGERAADPASAAHWLIKAGAGVALVTAGRGGMHVEVAPEARVGNGFVFPAVRNEMGRDFFIAGEVVEAAGTTGAGDAASAGFLAALIAGDTPSTAARFASRVAATVVSGRNVSDLSRI